MKTLSVTEVARNFSAVLDMVERDQQEIVLVRNQRQIARLVPEAARQCSRDQLLSMPMCRHGLSQPMNV